MHRFLLPALLLIVTRSSVARCEVDFSHAVVPILKKHCAECHTGTKSEGGFSFNTKRLLLESEHINLADPSASRIVELIKSTDAEDQMPPKDKPRLSPKEVSVLQEWIQTGTPWEAGFRFGITGYEPPLLPREISLPLPTVKGQNPIDSLMSVYYGENKVIAPAPVDDHVFIRRVYMDLIGLPPTLLEQEEFFGQAADMRRETLVDELLGRRYDYTEHWITFWNDLLRNDYVGTGYIDGGRKQITEWLYRGLLENKPYDVFVRELIAPTAESEGFISGIKWRGNVNASQIREVQFAQSVSQVFLGINMKCASCHDSFIDRWTLDEAYGLAAIYSQQELEIHRCDKPTGRRATAAWIFPELGEVDPSAEQPERLKQLAALMTSKQNGRFSRTIVNRLWHRLLGHGIVHPVDAMHTSPWNADLLDYLANYLVDSDYDLKAVLRLIATSDAYRGTGAAAQDWATSAEFVFRGPEPRHLSAEQLMDSVWQLTQSGSTSINAPIPTALYYGEWLTDVERTGHWIWTYADTSASPMGENASFWKTLSFDTVPQKAEMIITCDNEYVAWVNGRKVSEDKDWGTVEKIEFSKHLKAGQNEILIIAKNAGDSPNPAGLYAELVLTNGTKQRIATDETWKASRAVPENQDPSTVEWTNAVLVSPQTFLGPAAEASIRLRISEALLEKSRTARASLLKSDLLMRSLGRPNREQIVTTRPASLSTLQAIDLANGEILEALLASGGRNLADTAADKRSFVNNLFRSAVCRKAHAEEFNLADSVLGPEPTPETIQDLLWILIMLPEFQFVQ